MRALLLFFFGLILINVGCTDSKSTSKKKQVEDVKESIVFSDSIHQTNNIIASKIEEIQNTLKQSIPILLLKSSDANVLLAQEIAIHNTNFVSNIYDNETKKPLRTEIFNVYQARPQEIPAKLQTHKIYKVELYNFALNSTSTALVDLDDKNVVSVNNLPQSQPEIPTSLKDIALQLAVNNEEVIKALGYSPSEKEALMSNTRTALNNTKCERSMHLCVAPTFTVGEKALWVIVDLTDFKIVGIRWTNTGTQQPKPRLGERKLKFDKIMECYCKEITAVEKNDWKFNYIITTSDGLRISEVTFKNKVVINNCKVVDWHVNYSNTDGFGYSDAVGCPEFSQAAVVAVNAPRVSDIVENGQKVGFALEQNFSSEQWPLPCNYNYLQRFEFYNDGRFRPIAASLGRGCGNNGTYRPITRISFPSNSNTFFDLDKSTNWTPWKNEQWKLQDENTNYTNEKYAYKIASNENEGYYLEPGQGQFQNGRKGDHAFVYITKQHLDKDEGENDLVSIGPCCNTDYQQGPEKFINAESIENTNIVLWYVAQMKNDDTPGSEYCWCKNTIENGVFKTKVFPCMSGPMFVPIKSLK